MVPSDIKLLEFVKVFKFAIKKWYSDNCNTKSVKLAFHNIYFVFIL